MDYRKLLDAIEKLDNYSYISAILKNPSMDPINHKDLTSLILASEYDDNALILNLRGRLYLHGTGVEKDIKKAIQLFEKVKNSVPVALFNLGVIYKDVASYTDHNKSYEYFLKYYMQTKDDECLNYLIELKDKSKVADSDKQNINLEIETGYKEVDAQHNLRKRYLSQFAHHEVVLE